MPATNVQSDNTVGQFRGIFSEVRVAKGTIDFGAVNTAAEVVDTIAVDGVRLGDMVLGVSADTDVRDLNLTAYVTDANEVTITLYNNTGASINLVPAVFRVVVARPVF